MLSLRAKEDEQNRLMAEIIRTSRRSGTLTQNRRPEVMPTVLADANVLFSQEQRNILMTLALEGLFRLHWTRKIDDEWVRNRGRHLLKAGRDPIAPLRTAEKMRKAIPDFDPGDWQRFVEHTGATDSKDRHVAAAAIACAPSDLLTWNLTDFDAKHLQAHEVLVRNPDDFLCEVYDENPVLTYEASRRALGCAGSDDLLRLILVAAYPPRSDGHYIFRENSANRLRPEGVSGASVLSGSGATPVSMAPLIQ